MSETRLILTYRRRSLIIDWTQWTQRSHDASLHCPWRHSEDSWTMLDEDSKTSRSQATDEDSHLLHTHTHTHTHTHAHTHTHTHTQLEVLINSWSSHSADYCLFTGFSQWATALTPDDIWVRAEFQSAGWESPLTHRWNVSQRWLHLSARLIWVLRVRKEFRVELKFVISHIKRSSSGSHPGSVSASLCISTVCSDKQLFKLNNSWSRSFRGNMSFLVSSHLFSVGRIYCPFIQQRVLLTQHKLCACVCACVCVCVRLKQTEFSSWLETTGVISQSGTQSLCVEELGGRWGPGEGFQRFLKRLEISEVLDVPLNDLWEDILGCLRQTYRAFLSFFPVPSTCFICSAACRRSSTSKELKFTQAEAPLSNRKPAPETPHQ